MHAMCTRATASITGTRDARRSVMISVGNSGLDANWHMYALEIGPVGSQAGDYIKHRNQARLPLLSTPTF